MKGNMFLGYARGSVGDVVFSRSNGQQQARARNRQPNNPKTPKQMMQRSLFANAVKFHSKGVQRLFKFAFEDKGPNESDYNAFMKHNMRNGVRISKQASQEPLYPALGNWQMSCGSIESPLVNYNAGSHMWIWTAPGVAATMNKWGQLCTALKAQYGLQEGDIVTFVHITAIGATSINVPSIEPDSGLQGSDWNITQYLVDSTSQDPVPTFLSTSDGYIDINFDDISIQTYCQGACVIFSRRAPGGLKVSSSYLICNEVAENCIAASKAEEFEELVLQSWNTSEEAILQGSLIP